MYLSTGISARRSSNYENSNSYEMSDSEKIKIKTEILDLRNNAKAACKLLKVDNVEFYDFPDNEMDSIPLLKIIKIIEKEILKIKPERIYTNHFGDLNIDHRTVFNATLTACRPLNYIVKELVSFEVLSSTEWNYPNTFNPNYFVNIKSTLNRKIKAFQQYENEIQKFPHPRSPKNITNVSGRWGSVSGFQSAEAFEIIRKLEK
jgi:LmbE family N-acetylglucosaminyl deacetylase